MSFTLCSGCPNFWQCREAGECLDARARRAIEAQRTQIADGLAAYDAKRAELAAQRAVDPKWLQPKPIDKAPVCWHTFSPFGICTKPGCGYWKQS